MSNSFDQAMHKIARQDTEQRQAEMDAARDRARFLKIRKVVLFIVGAALIGYAFTHRVELGQRIQNLTAKDSATDETGVGKNLKGFQEAAEKRDAALEELTKK